MGGRDLIGPEGIRVAKKKKKTGGGTGNWHDDAMGLQ
jgi:hypothetical protein